MPEPTLSEILNTRPEASTDPGVVLEGGAEMVRNLNQAAQFNAEMKQRKYAQSLGMLKDIYQDIGAVQAMPIMDEDRPVINKKLSGIFEEIGNDPRNALAGNKFPEIEKKLGEVRALASQSKQDHIYDTFHSQYLQSEPELDTPENRTKIEEHNKQPLGQRKKYTLDTPVKFDPESAMGNILKQKNVSIPYATTDFSPDNKFITRETGTRYDRSNALALWNQGYNVGTDKNNQPIRKWAEQQYTKIQNNPSELEKYGNPKNAQEFYNALGEMMYGSKEDIVGEKTSTQVPNPYELLNKRQENTLYTEAIKEGNREKLAAVKKTLEQQGAPENANFLVRQYANIIGNTTGDTKTTSVGGGKYETEDVVNVDHSILKNWANTSKQTLKAGSTLDPITETIISGNMPDYTTRTKDGNIRYVIYQHYKKGDKIPAGKNVGDIVKTQNGVPILEKQGIIPKRSLLAAIGTPVIEKKILASSIDQADSFLKGRENADIDKINQGAEPDSEQPQKTIPSKGKTYKLGNKSYSESQIQKAAKLSGVSVDEYIKKVGLK